MRHLGFVASVLVCPLLCQGWVDRTGAGGPPPLDAPHMCYDPVRSYMLLVGRVAGGTSTETWSYDGQTWTYRGSAPTHGPIGFSAHTGQMLLAHWSATYIWDGMTWSLVGGGFGANQPVEMAYDPHRRQMLAVTVSSQALQTSVWSGASWQQVSATSNAGQVTGPVHMAFDPVSLKVVVAISTHSYVLQAGTWVQVPITGWYEWSGYGWNQRLPGSVPAAAGVMATDTLRQRIIMFDGEYTGLHPNGWRPFHTWSISNGNLTRLSTPIEPSLRERAAMDFDPQRNLFVLFGGMNTAGAMADTWEFDLGPAPSFSPYGTGCVGSRGVVGFAAQGSSVPRVGTTFTALATNLPWNGPAFVILGVSDTSYSGTPLPADLGFLGAPSCFLRTSIDDIQPLVNVLGAATWTWPVPPVPGAVFYTQVLPLEPGQNLLGLTASNGCRAVVGM